VIDWMIAAIDDRIEGLAADQSIKQPILNQSPDH
jgi:hypothetical protein